MTSEYNNRIEMYNYKLSERHLILSNIESVVRPYGLTMTIGSHGGVILYWTQYTKAQIVSHDVDANKTKVIRTENPQLLEIKMFSKKRQPSGGGCQESECAEFCFITPTLTDGSRTCSPTQQVRCCLFVDYLLAIC